MGYYINQQTFLTHRPRWPGEWTCTYTYQKVGELRISSFDPDSRTLCWFRWRDGRSQKGTQWRYHGKKDLGIESLHEKHLWVCLNIALNIWMCNHHFPYEMSIIGGICTPFQEPKIFPPVFLLRHVFPVVRGERLGAMGIYFLYQMESQGATKSFPTTSWKWQGKSCRMYLGATTWHSMWYHMVWNFDARSFVRVKWLPQVVDREV